MKDPVCLTDIDLHQAGAMSAILEDGTRKVHLGREAAWLFVCGRDIFEENIERVEGVLELGSHYLVMFDGRCVGYGRYETSAGIHVVRNLFDLGDFLRREDSG